MLAWEKPVLGLCDLSPNNWICVSTKVVYLQQWFICTLTCNVCHLFIQWTFMRYLCMQDTVLGRTWLQRPTKYRFYHQGVYKNIKMYIHLQDKAEQKGVSWKVKAIVLEVQKNDSCIPVAIYLHDPPRFITGTKSSPLGERRDKNFIILTLDSPCMYI